jgi:polyisoprenoid-binding protein YceI
MNRLKHVIALGALLLASPASHAVEYTQVRSELSSIGFSYQQMGVGMDGHFTKFAGQLRFDPARPAAASLVIDVALASIDAGSSEADDEVAGKEWFNTAAFPSAHFVATRIQPAGANRYDVAGRLTIKGRTRELVVPATFTTRGTRGTFDGRFTLQRADFAIGEGAWAKFDVVANDIAVKFRITADAGTPAAK